MLEPGFTVDTTLPFAWQAGAPPAAIGHGSLLLLRVVNLLDGHEAEANRAQERVEARLDLMLHWLGMQLFGNQPVPASRHLRLAAGRIEWAEDDALAAQEIVLNLHIHPAMSAPLKLHGHVASHSAGWAVAELRFDDETLAEAWTQWLFRLHRRAVQEARHRAATD